MLAFQSWGLGREDDGTALRDTYTHQSQLQVTHALSRNTTTLSQRHSLPLCPLRSQARRVHHAPATHPAQPKPPQTGGGAERPEVGERTYLNKITAVTTRTTTHNTLRLISGRLSFTIVPILASVQLLMAGRKEVGETKELETRRARAGGGWPLARQDLEAARRAAPAPADPGRLGPRRGARASRFRGSNLLRRAPASRRARTRF